MAPNLIFLLYFIFIRFSREKKIKLREVLQVDGWKREKNIFLITQVSRGGIEIGKN